MGQGLRRQGSLHNHLRRATDPQLTPRGHWLMSYDDLQLFVSNVLIGEWMRKPLGWQVSGVNVSVHKLATRAELRRQEVLIKNFLVLSVVSGLAGGETVALIAYKRNF